MRIGKAIETIPARTSMGYAPRKKWWENSVYSTLVRSALKHPDAWIPVYCKDKTETSKVSASLYNIRTKFMTEGIKFTVAKRSNTIYVKIDSASKLVEALSNPE